MTEKNDFEVIMKEITMGMTGDPETDIKYLFEQMEKYKEHEYSKEILRACGRLMYEIIPEDQKEELNKLIDKDNMGFNAAFEEIQFNIYKKNYDKALKLMENMVRNYEEQGLYANDAVSEYYCFREAMEEILYRLYNEPQKDLRIAQIDYAEMYFQYGSLLIEMNRIEDAANALEKAKRWNPSSAKIVFEYAETFKMRGMIKEFGEITRSVFKYAFRPADLARCYRNMAFYFVENKEYKVAVCCLLYSIQFEKSEMVSSELYYISQKTGEMYNPSEDELKKHFKTHGIPTGPEVEMLKNAYAYGMHFHDHGDDDNAVYFFEIFAAFINDDEVNKILEEIAAKG